MAIKTVTINTTESTSNVQTGSIALPSDLKAIKSITVSTGSVDKYYVNGGLINVSLINGSYTRYVTNYYNPSEYVTTTLTGSSSTFPSTTNVTSPSGYTGSIPTSGSSYLSQASDSKAVSASVSGTYTCDWVSNSSTTVSWSAGGGGGYSFSSTYAYNSGGYSGTLPIDTTTHTSCNTVVPTTTAPVGTHRNPTVSATATYSGTATKPAVYSQNYAGYVYGPTQSSNTYYYSYTVTITYFDYTIPPTPVITAPSAGSAYNKTESISWTQPTGPLANTIIYEDFEDTTYNFPFTGDWIRSTVKKSSGSYSYANKDIGGNGVSYAQFDVTIPSGATEAYISFDWLTSCEATYDKLNIWVGGVKVSYFSGTTLTTWSQFSKELPVGTTTIKFEYTKDASGDAGDDTVYIDNLTIGYIPSVNSGYQYNVQYSSNNGTTWKDLYVLTSPGVLSVNYDFTNELSTSQALIKIRAYDGINYSNYATSPSFLIQHQVIIDTVKIQTTNGNVIIPIYDPNIGMDGANQLRIYNTSIGCFNLVPIGDSKASPLRVYTSEGIKAIQKQ